MLLAGVHSAAPLPAFPLEPYRHDDEGHHDLKIFFLKSISSDLQEVIGEWPKGGGVGCAVFMDCQIMQNLLACGSRRVSNKSISPVTPAEAGVQGFL